MKIFEGSNAQVDLNIIAKHQFFKQILNAQSTVRLNLSPREAVLLKLGLMCSAVPEQCEGSANDESYNHTYTWNMDGQGASRAVYVKQFKDKRSRIGF